MHTLIMSACLPSTQVRYHDPALVYAYRIVVQTFISPVDGKTFISGGKDGSLRVFEVESGEQILQVSFLTSPSCLVIDVFFITIMEVVEE